MPSCPPSTPGATWRAESGGDAGLSGFWDFSGPAALSALFLVCSSAMVEPTSLHRVDLRRTRGELAPDSIVPYADPSRSRIAFAATGITVPGPKMATAPCS